MRLGLYFNPNAGVQSFDVDDIAELLRARGDEVRAFIKGDGDVGDAIAWKADVLVAAGGDGTIARAATALWKHRSQMPLFILPIGTSNNIAWTLGVTGTPPELVRAIARARDAQLDVGIASADGDGDEAPFVEAVGAGFFSDALRRSGGIGERTRIAIRRLMGRPSKGEANVRAAARGIARHLRRAPAREYAILADHEDLSGRYVAVEAMNISAIGPRAKLALDADPGDGALDLVLIRPEHREALADFIESHLDHGAPDLERRRVGRLELRWTEGGGHLDDEVWPANGHGAGAARRVSVAIGGSVRLLLPQTSETKLTRPLRSR